MLARYRAWVFDLDGTLTVHQHDFAAIRAELGIPPERYILEYLAELAADAAGALRARLDALEAELTSQALAAPGAAELLAALAARGARCGILTRNSRDNALATLAQIGLAAHFAPVDVLGRDEAAPKPAPDGITHLINAWQLPGAATLMLGDFHLDLEAGRNAGVATVHVSANPTLQWPELTDYRVRSLADLLPLL